MNSTIEITKLVSDLFHTAHVKAGVQWLVFATDAQPAAEPDGKSSLALVHNHEADRVTALAAIHAIMTSYDITAYDLARFEAETESENHIVIKGDQEYETG